ncbi:MAG: hypothetical protein MJ166_06585 [Clostridia bacterium]|nr:hypothetical protein [Clostridia bacterium]
MNIVNLYIDPATTSYIIQIAAGVFLTLGTFLAIFWNKITRKFRKKDDKVVEKTSKNETRKDKDVVIKAEDLLDD